MKTILSILVALTLAVGAFAQQQTKTVVIPENMLTVEQKAQIEMQQTQAAVQRYGEWVGLGRELGSAIDGGLTAVEKHADSIANTKVGTLTMFLITYKVIGTDVIQVVGAVLFSVLWVPIYAFAFWRIAIPKRVLGEEVYNPDNGKLVKKIYKQEGGYDDDMQWVLILWGIAFAAGTGITCAIAFT